MKSVLQALLERAGSYEGRGVNHEGQAFVGKLTLSPEARSKGLALRFRATGEDGTVYHEESSLIGPNIGGALSLWILSDNHPGVFERNFREVPAAPGASTTLAFTFGRPEDQGSFRETVSIDLWPGGDLGYRYAWGMPGGEFKERSGARMSPSR